MGENAGSRNGRLAPAKICSTGGKRGMEALETGEDHTAGNKKCGSDMYDLVSPVMVVGSGWGVGLGQPLLW